MDTKDRFDIYDRVRQHLSKLVKHDADLSRLLQGPEGRSLVKKPTMTFVYGVTQYEMRNQIARSLRDHRLARRLKGRDITKLAAKLTSSVNNAIVKRAGRAAEALAWFKDCAAVMTDAGLPIAWTTPVGMHVVQKRVRTESQRVSIWYAGQRIRPRLEVDTEVIDKGKQQSALTANWVHSHDAAHVILIANRAAAAGIESLAMVHDSFATHAGQTALLRDIVRQTFISLYETDRLAAFRAELVAQLRDAGCEDLIARVPDTPKRGSFDLKRVLKSEFAFS